MNDFVDAFRILADGASWRGEQGLWQPMLQQLLITVTALGIALAIGLPVALWLGHLGRGGFLAINISGVGRAVPTYAVLALLTLWEPVGTAPLGPYGRAGLATLLALALFGLPPIVTNAFVGINQVPSDLREAADGMGMSGWQKFRKVELPLAMPLVVTGIRISLVQMWATATIAALVAGPGLGLVIMQGFSNAGDEARGIAAAILVAAIALVLELAAVFVQRLARTSRPDTRGIPPRDTEGEHHERTSTSRHLDAGDAPLSGML